MSVEAIARRYSTALADVVLSSGSSEAVKAELAAFGEMIDGNDELASVFANPSISHVNKEKVLGQLIARTKPSTTTANFLRVLLQNSRLTELGGINERFAAVLEERGGVVSAEITSVRELPDSERAEFEQALAKLTGKQVTINYSVDADLIGGTVTRIGSTVYDSSVRTKLDTLRTELIGTK
ncbi:MAG: ATP synthase F1 subunit delta [Chloracidobacterium sp.]|nr:ATP synthase F1 subunit delta [Chloracidobacterium sp.]